MFGCCLKGSKEPSQSSSPDKKQLQKPSHNQRSKEKPVESNSRQKQGHTNQPNSENNKKHNTRSNNNNKEAVSPEAVILREKSASYFIIKPEGGVVLRERSAAYFKQTPVMAENLESLVARLEAAVVKLEGHGGAAAVTAAAGATASAREVTSPFVSAYDEILNGPLKQFLSHSAKIGDHVNTQADMVLRAFTAQREFLVRASKAKSPPQDILVKLLAPTSECISQIQSFREGNRKSAMFNHLSAISESVSALGWVAVSPTPGPFVKEMSDAGQFYSNRVLKEFREKDATHVDWVKSWLATLTQMQAYIKQHHTTGVSWNAQGVEASTLTASSGKGAAPPPPPPAAGGPPPPPPPPPPVEAPAGGAGGDDQVKVALFADLNKGADVTKGLKKVSDDMKTHKNPKLRTGPAPYKPNISPKPGRVTMGGGAAAKPEPVVKPPRCVLEGKRWLVEHQRSNKNLVISDTELRHTVYIYKCDDSVVQVKGKINSIVMDSCKKSAVVFDSLVSSMEFVNCQSVQGQVNEMVNLVSIDKTDGCMMYLSKQAAGAEIVTAKSSEMNVLVPDDTGDYKEYPIPEQFKTTLVNGKLKTTVSDV